VLDMTLNVEAMDSGVFRRAEAERSALWDLFPAVLQTVARAPSGEFAAAAAFALVGELGASFAVVHAADGEPFPLRLAARCGLADGDAALLTASLHADAEGPIAEAAREGVVQIADRARGGVILALPLLGQGRVLAVLTAELDAPPALRDLEVFEALASALGLAAERARLAELLAERDGWARLVAHELAQPLNSIALHAAWLLRGLSTEKDQRAARLIIDGVGRAKRLVGDLTSTVVDPAKVALEPKETDLATLTRCAASCLACGGGDNPVLVESRGAPTVRVDPARLQQVLANLLVNASKYGPKGATIRAEIERVGSEVILAITNEGEIDADERERVFDRYYRARNAGRAGGWGIGLYVCRALVQAHGGRIDVRSGQGTTTFEIALPSSEPSAGVGEVQAKAS
jgi:signal transduction histidine kinase